MATNDDIAAQLHAIAEAVSIGNILDVKEKLLQDGQAVGAAISVSSAHYSPVMGALGEAIGQIDNALAAVEQFRLALQEAANGHLQG